MKKRGRSYGTEHGTQRVLNLHTYQNQDSDSFNYLLLFIYRADFLFGIDHIAHFWETGLAQEDAGQLCGQPESRGWGKGEHLAWFGSCAMMLKSYRCQVPTVLELTLRWILKTIQIDLSFWKVFRMEREETMKHLQFKPPTPWDTLHAASTLSRAPSHYPQWVLPIQG